MVVEKSSLTGTIVAGRFRVVGSLGTGSMADVYLAEQTSLKRNVAVKILRSDQLGKSRDNLLKRFKQEAKAAGARAIPGIGMFVQQAAIQFELWTGQPAPLDVMTGTVTEALS